MITTIILFLIYGLLFVIISPIRLLPDVSLPVEITQNITTFRGYLTSIDAIFPITTLLIIFGLLLSVELAIFTYKVIMWLIKKIPTID